VQKTVIALGFFDGIHLGHAALLRRTVEIAWQTGATPAMMTFDTHPDELIGDSAVPLLTSPEERARLVQELFGIDNIIALRFDENLRNMPWEDFIDWLISDFGAVYFVVGHDFRFGQRAEGNAEKLIAKIEEVRSTRDPRVGCDVISAVKLNGVTVSSTHIRKLLLDGEIAAANGFFGHTYRLTDTVKFGYRLGRTIGAPTINMRFPPGVLVPKHGVYATRLRIEDEYGIRYAVTNVGSRPTVASGSDVTVESYILDFDRVVYGKRVQLEFLDFVREERKFDGIDELKAQIALDAERVRQLTADI
jgi:riboflavin kinase/FMN adenylyltransferase